ncbi:MAG: DNA-formamidopyrimidine glycosylase family protein [Acidimicrobiia bacterium]|nr:DNA-formamidopyrimidine glycosylase family protein [Acidimicrobiia bacterium]
MPEGHVLHRAARLQAKALGHGSIAVSSPQGRFAEGARLLDGHRIERIRAVGKHLFYEWDHDPILHVHLGLFGKFKTFASDPPPPTPATRVQMIGASTVYLAGPTTCEILDGAEVDELVRRLGPDPLDADADPDRFHRAMARRSVPVGSALLDQAAIAGIGNVYRSELLFLSGISPKRPANEVTTDELDDLWKRSVDLLSLGERMGRIVTVDPKEVGAGSPREIPRPLRLYVYKRGSQPCRRCETEIASAELGGRSMWFCPSCQPA